MYINIYFRNEKQPNLVYQFQSMFNKLCLSVFVIVQMHVPQITIYFYNVRNKILYPSFYTEELKVNLFGLILSNVQIYLNVDGCRLTSAHAKV